MSKTPASFNAGISTNFLKQRIETFSSKNKVSISLVSFNVNSKNPIKFNFNSQIVVFGLQEIDTSTSAYLIDNKELWSTSLLPTHQLVAKKQLVGLLLLIYSNGPVISEMQCSSVSTGIMGLVANKGAVAIRFKCLDSYFCIVNSHLAADQNNTDRRNQDFADQVSRLYFPDAFNISSVPWVPRLSETQYKVIITGSGSPGNLSVFDCDFLFWLGDLNYRIDSTDAKIRSTLPVITDLLNQDQLTQEIKSKNAFLDFLEAPITFQPTYKYDIGTSIYDSSEKKRPPAWCDRILYHIPKNPTDVEIIEYNSIDSVTTSDHKPVFLNLNVSLREIDAIKFESCLADLTRLLDKIENDNIPDVKISTNLLEYGQIRFLDPVIKTINIENVGKSIANVKFLECKKWIVLNPSSTSLLPGENITIDVLINIDSLTASEFNSGIPSQDILILHIEQSRDFFIDVMCDWEKSCFGAELSDLCQGEKSLPKQLWRIIDFLYKHGKDIQNIFQVRGDIKISSLIRKSLDLDIDFDFSVFNGDDPLALPPRQQSKIVHSMVDVLIQFLSSLKTPIIPVSVQDQIVEYGFKDYAASKTVLNAELSLLHFNCFMYVCLFLKEFLNDNVDALASVFAPVFFRRDLSTDLFKRKSKLVVMNIINGRILI